MSLQLLAQWSQIAGAVVFLIAVVAIWNKWLAPGVKAYQAAKNAEIAEAESRRERMRAAVAEARGEVEKADADARTIQLRIVTAIEAEHARILADAKAEVDRIVRNAEGELDRARLAARDRLRIEFIEKALAKARGDAVTRIDAALDERLVTKTVEDLTRGRA
jgi:F0F1-type ATP synthase membrane subunit b/b'